MTHVFLSYRMNTGQHERTGYATSVKTTLFNTPFLTEIQSTPTYIPFMYIVQLYFLLIQTPLYYYTCNEFE